MAPSEKIFPSTFTAPGLDGVIPDCVYQLPRIALLVSEGVKIQGTLPQTMSTSLEVLDISQPHQGYDPRHTCHVASTNSPRPAEQPICGWPKCIFSSDISLCVRGLCYFFYAALP
jgi:hypothetical protein